MCALYDFTGEYNVVIIVVGLLFGNNVLDRKYLRVCMEIEGCNLIFLYVFLHIQMKWKICSVVFWKVERGVGEWGVGKMRKKVVRPARAHSKEI